MTEKDIDRIESEYLNDCENTLEMEKVFDLAKRGLIDIRIYDTEAEKLNEAAAKVGESVATVIEWLVEENLDDLVKEQSNERI